MKTEWTSARIRVMRRNTSIRGRNKFIEDFNAWFGTAYPSLPLENLPSATPSELVQASQEIVPANNPRINSSAIYKSL